MPGIEIMIGNAALGVLSGLFVAGAGYFKTTQSAVPGKKADPFDGLKFGKTVVLGGIVGGIVGATGWTQDAAVLFMSNAGVTTLVENVWKALARRFAKK